MKAFCIGRNYVAHAKELNNDIPTEPVIFIKSQDAFVDLAQQRFAPPEHLGTIHYEAELVYRFGADCSSPLSEKEALSFVDAYTVGLDLTARAVQDHLKEKRLPWEKAKAFKHSAMLGTWFPYEAKTPHPNLTFEFFLNDQLTQIGNSANQIFNVAQLIAYISQFFVIQKGDVLFTGTPPGVGVLPIPSRIKATLGEKLAFEYSL